jgi:hypothetical protein
MKKLLIIAILSIGALNNFAQKKDATFEGTITYSVSVQGDLDPQVKAGMPSEVVYTFKGPKVHTLMKTAYGNVSTITNSETKEQVVLYDMMGQKMALTSTKEETEQAIKDLPSMKINITNETKKILNYNCKKIEVSDGKATLYVYVTDEINIPNPNWNTQFKDINGVMLEYSQKASPDADALITFTAKEVKKSKVKDNIFDIPTDYKKMSMSEFKQMFGGNE